MKGGRIVVRGQAYLSLETAAQCYEVEVSFVRDVYEHGLLGAGEPVGDSLAFAAAHLDRLAVALRLHRQLGINVEGIATLLAELEEE